LSSPSKLRERTNSGEKRGFFASIKKGKFFSLGSKTNSPAETRPPLTSTPGNSRMDGLASDFNAALNLSRHDVAIPSPNAPPDEEARLLQKRMLHYLHRHLQRFCPDATAEQCLDWANDYHNCQFLQSTEVFRSMMNVRTSPETVAACRAAVSRRSVSGNEVRLTKSVLQAAFEGKPRGSPSADFVTASQIPRRVTSSAGTAKEHEAISEVDNERVLFRLMEKLYFVIQELSFPFPQGFHHRFVTLAYRSLPRPIFKQYLSNRVLRVTEEFVMRTLQELEDCDSVQDDRFKFFLLSFLDSDALARAHKEWMHSESQRYLSHITVASLLDAAEDDRGQPSTSDDEEDVIQSDANHAVSFPPLRAFMRTMQKKEKSTSRLPSAIASPAARVKLSFVEDSALISSTQGSMEDSLDVSF